MPSPAPPPKPTEAELSILRVLWNRGPSTVREVMEALADERDLGYTSVLKFLQIMFEKGLVKRDDSLRTHVYSAAQPAEKMRRRLVGDLVDRVFSGSVSQLVMHALGTSRPDAGELKAIRRMLDDLDPPSKKKPQP
jgi:BlaI family penicillinase repressor